MGVKNISHLPQFSTECDSDKRSESVISRLFVLSVGRGVRGCGKMGGNFRGGSGFMGWSCVEPRFSPPFGRLNTRVRMTLFAALRASQYAPLFFDLSVMLLIGVRVVTGCCGERGRGGMKIGVVMKLITYM